MPKDQTLITPRLPGGIVPRVTHCNVGNTFDDDRVGLAEFEVDYEVPACAAGTATNAVLAGLLPESKVPVGCKTVLTDFHVYFPGPTAWNNGVSMIVRDSAPSGEAFDFLAVDNAHMTSGSLARSQGSAQDGVTLYNVAKTLAGGGVGRGLNLWLVGGTAPTAGSAFRIHLRGFFKRA